MLSGSRIHRCCSQLSLAFRPLGSRWKSYCTRLPQKSVLELTGPDAQKFLKGLACRDVETTRGGYSGFLNASGRVLHTVFIHPLDPHGERPSGYLIVHESPLDHPAPLTKLLPPFRLRSRVKFKDVTDDWTVWSVWGDEASSSHADRTWKRGSGGSAEAVWTFPRGFGSLEIGADEIGCWDLRAGSGASGMGKQVLVPKGSTPSFASRAQEVANDEYDLHRISRGVPDGSLEIIPEIALPLESCMDLHGGVDFRKGCYLGQELTVRTYHTGVTRKRILPVRLFSLAETSRLIKDSMELQLPHISGPVDVAFHPATGSPSQKSKSAGKVLKLHGSISSVALGLIRLELASRCWMEDQKNMTIEQWASGNRLTATIDGQELGLVVGKGEAYEAANSGESS